MSIDSPQLADGYTPVANPIMEALARTQLSGYEWRALLFLLRKTYGWNKKSDIISLSQFEDGTGLDRRHVARTIKRLLEKKIITTDSASLGTSKMSTYTFNKHFGEWVDSAKLGTSADLGTKGSADLGTKGSAKTGTHNNNPLQKKSSTKETPISPEVSEVLAYLNEKVKRNFKVPGDIPARLKDYSVEDCKTVIDKKCKEWLGTDLARHLDPVTLFRPSNFDRYLNQVEGTGNKAIFKEWVKGHPDLDWHRFGEDNQYARACTYLLAFKAAEKSGQVQFETGDLEAQQLAIQIKTEETQKSIRGGKR